MVYHVNVCSLELISFSLFTGIQEGEATVIGKVKRET